MANGTAGLAGTYQGILARPELEQQGSSAIGAAITGTVGALNERWWKKERDEFKVGPMARFQEKINEIGEMSNVGEEEGIDVGSMWSKLKNAVIDFQEEAVKYKGNPYVSHASAAAVESVTKGMDEILGGRLREAQTQQAAAETGLIPERRRLLQAQTAAASARAGGMKTTYGQMRGDPSAWLDSARTSTAYKTLREQARVTAGREAWGQLDDDAKLMYGGRVDNFLKAFTLSEEKYANFDKDIAANIVDELEVDPAYRSLVLRDMLKEYETLNVARAEEGGKVNFYIPRGSSQINSILLMTPDVPAGRLYDVKPSRIPGDSPAGEILNRYRQLRIQGVAHDVAKKAMTNEGAFEVAISKRIDLSTNEGIRTAQNMIFELDQLIDEEADQYGLTTEETEEGQLEAWPGILPSLQRYFTPGGAPLLERATREIQEWKELVAGEEIPEAVRRLPRLQPPSPAPSPSARPTPRLLER